MDIKLSPRAQEVFPYAVECKNVERAFTAVFDAYAQAKQNSELLEPIVVIKKNRERPLVVMDLETFMRIC